jgi:hypothetical protein
MVREFHDDVGETRGKNWGYQSIAPSKAYRDGYEGIRWDDGVVAPIEDSVLEVLHTQRCLVCDEDTEAD